MKALLCAVALALLPSSLFAGPIYETVTFETTLSIAVYVEYPSLGEPVGFEDAHYIPYAFTEWHVPTFDPALGVVEGVDLSWTVTGGHSIVTSDPPGVVGPPIVVLLDNFSGALSGANGVFTTMFYTPESPPIHWGIWIHSDSHATYDIGYSATFDILLTGPATATYYYTPAAAIPEPASLLLLGSGLIGAEWKRRRRHG